jgi:plastocyanin
MGCELEHLMNVNNRPRLHGECWSLVLAVMTLSPAAFGVTTNINVNPSSFTPDPVVINVNDTVKWTWVSDNHNTVSQIPGLWASDVLNNGATFTHTFPAQGEFFYTCTIHGFGGVISVLGPAVTNVNIRPNAFDPPVVEVHVNDTVKWTWVSDFHNTASDTGIWNSQIYNSGFAYEFTFTSAGSFPYSCQVHGFTGSVTAQSATIPPSVLIAPQFIPPSTFQFNYSASSGQSYVVQRSSDLSAWVSLKTNVAGGGSVFFQDTNAAAAKDFYRVFQLSTP